MMSDFDKKEYRRYKKLAEMVSKLGLEIRPETSARGVPYVVVTRRGFFDECSIQWFNKHDRKFWVVFYPYPGETQKKIKCDDYDELTKTLKWLYPSEEQRTLH